jgi:hypothetical protein
MKSWRLPWPKANLKGPKLIILTLPFCGGAGGWLGWAGFGACPAPAGPTAPGCCPGIAFGRGGVTTTGLRQVGQTCWRSSQLLRQPRCNTWPHGSFFGRERSLTIGVGACGRPFAPPAAGACPAPFAAGHGLISSRQMMQVSSLWKSSSVASGYLWFIS